MTRTPAILPSPTEIAGELVREIDAPDGTVTLVWGANGVVLREGVEFVEAGRLAGAMRADLVRLVRGYVRAMQEADRQIARLEGQVAALRADARPTEPAPRSDTFEAFEAYVAAESAAIGCTPAELIAALALPEPGARGAA